MRFSSRKLAEAIYGGHQPRDVALAVALGIVAGAISGGNVSWAPILLAAILFNVHTRLFLAAWLASVLLAWITRARLETVGRFLLDGTPLGHALGQFGDGTLIALLGWDRYAVVGGGVAGAVAAAACAFAAHRIARALEQRYANVLAAAPASGEAEQLNAAPRSQRVLVRVWRGPSIRERSMRREMSPRRLRRFGVPTALAASLALGITSWSLAGWLATRGFLQEFSAYNGAQVSTASTELSLWGGQFVVRDLHIADPRRLDHDRVRIGVAKGRLVPGSLLRGHLEIEKLVLEQVKLDVARRTPARSVGVAGVGPELRSVGKFVPAADDLVIDGGVRHWQTVCRQLDSLSKAVAAIEQLSRAEDATQHARIRLPRDHRSDLGTQLPWVAIYELRIADLSKGWNVGRKALLEVTNVSSNPALASRDTELKVVLPAYGAELRLEFALKHRGQPHTFRCSAYDLDLAQLIDKGAVCQTVAFLGGRSKLSGEGSFDRQRLNVRLQADVDSLSSEVTSTEPLAGIEPAVWKNGLARLGSFHTELQLAGPWSSPNVVVDRRRLVQAFKQQLLAIGERELAYTIEQQLVAFEVERAQPVVVQASAVGPESVASQPGYCEFSEEGNGPDALDAVVERATYRTAADIVSDATESTQQAPVRYPTTAVPDDDSAGLPPHVASPVPDTATVARRPLPGPVNMVVGRDPNLGAAFSSSDVGALSQQGGQRENFLSRWAHGVRHKLGQAFAVPESTDSVPDEPPPSDRVRPTDEDDDRSIPAAASETWYNRRWR